MKGRPLLLFGVGLASALAAFTWRTPVAEACGGCISPPGQVARVESHRMVIRLGLENTTLWDQIIYSGNAEDFVWLLPVPNENVVVEVADPAFFDFIEDGSRPAVQPARPYFREFCGGGGGSSGFGCAATSYDASGGGDDAPPEDSVEIFDQRTVGPYETVVIGSADPAALTTWLLENGYNVGEESQPALDHYVELGSAFVVLRLAPGEDTNSMQPVRVTYDGFMGQFPLKMVAVGARGILDLSLWVIAEQRYEVANYGTVEMSGDDITWDFETDTSNYEEAFNATTVATGNRAWIAEYAHLLNSLSRRAPAPPFSADEDMAIARDVGSEPFITRLRTQVLVEHLDEDLMLAPAENFETIDGLYLATQEVNRPPDVVCADAKDDGGAACRAGNTHRASGTLLLLLLALLFVARRSRRTVTGRSALRRSRRR